MEEFELEELQMGAEAEAAAVDKASKELGMVAVEDIVPGVVGALEEQARSGQLEEVI
jgi:hypothetical protein